MLPGVSSIISGFQKRSAPKIRVSIDGKIIEPAFQDFPAPAMFDDQRPDKNSGVVGKEEDGFSMEKKNIC